ncbi:hypothetical protein [Peristeroidobacter agariperforans]|uniref:hypothetical protein n=1 Tax=Peristeroidobacter agariperforans TaxID=268404 RepID=UPI00101B93F8|nr:hypothetical protein [Peristeroidobacter agariperforans]
MEYVLQQLWLVIGLTAFIVGALYWRRQHLPVTATRTAARPPAPIVYRDSPTVRVADSQRVDRSRKVVRINVGESLDVLATAVGLPPRFRISVKNIVDGSDLEAAHICVQFGGAQLSCGPLVHETAFNEYVIPRASRDEHRSSVFYYYERGDSLEFMRIKLKSADLDRGQVELDVMQLHGHWPSHLGADS